MEGMEGMGEMEEMGDGRWEMGDWWVGNPMKGQLKLERKWK